MGKMLTVPPLIKSHSPKLLIVKNSGRDKNSVIQNNIERRLWAIADELRANSRLRVSDYSPLVC